MKILLVGEYSNLHNSLKAGLEKLGHTVTILGLNDGFKNYPVDISIKKKYNSGLIKKLKVFLHIVFKIDLYSINIEKQIKKHLPIISNYDVVQFINEASFMCTPNTEIRIFNLIKKQNKKTFLLSCGTDYLSVKYAFDKKLKYSFLTPFYKNKGKKENYQSPLKYLKPQYKKLHLHIFKNVNGVIASDIDYHIPLQHRSEYIGMIPNPINLDSFEYKAMDKPKRINIFHGINTKNYYKKGNDIFDAALEIIKKTYKDKVIIKSVKDLPYKEYINCYNEAHILLDQIYSYDQGYNALEAMAKGKVVFTGIEKECLEYYNLKENVIGINATPCVNTIVEKLEWLILNPERITEISANARAFIINEHNYKIIAQRYLDLWNA